MAKQRLFRVEDAVSVLMPTQLTVSAEGLVAMSVVGLSTDRGKALSRIWLLDPHPSLPPRGGGWGGGGARPITAETRPATAPRFSPDGKSLAYKAELDEGKSQVMLLVAPFGEPVQLTRFENGVNFFDWSPDGKELLVVAVPDTEARKKKARERKIDGTQADVDEPRARLWLVSRDGGKPRPVGSAAGHVNLASWSPDGKSIALVWSPHSTLDVIWKDSELRLVDVRSGRARTLRRLSTIEANAKPPAFSPDGTRIAIADTLRPGQIYPTCLRVVNVADGRSVVVDRKADQTAAMPEWLGGDALLFIQQQGATRALRVAPADGKPGWNAIEWPGCVHAFAAPAKAPRVFFIYSEGHRPFEVYSVDVDGRDEPRRLTRLNRHLDAVRMAPAEVVRWKSREGWTVEGLLFRPTKPVKAPCATILVPHGGPYGASSNGYAETATVQVFCARGYAVLLPNFRGSTGYGSKFLLSNVVNWGTGPADDCVRGIEHLVRRRLADPKRLVIQGGSYGGYMTAWLVGHYDRFRAAVAHAPVVDNVSMWGTTDIPHFMEWSMGGDVRTRFKDLRRLSPVAHLGRCRTATLVITGDKDVRVPVGQSQELYRTLKAAGVATGLVLYPREGHGVAEPRHRIDMIKRILAWFRTHLGKDGPDR